MSNPNEYIGLAHDDADILPAWRLRKIGLMTTVLVLCVNCLLIACFPVRRATDVPVELLFNLINFFSNATVERLLSAAAVLPDYKLVRGPDDYAHLFLKALAGAVMWGTIATCVAWTWRRMNDSQA